MSVELLSNRAVFAAAACRVVGAAVTCAANVAESVADGLRDASKGVWMLEAHYGRRYEAAVGVDLCGVVGERVGSYSESYDDDEE